MLIADGVTAGVICLLAAIPVVTVRRRRLRQTEGIAALMVLWGLVAAGSIVYFANAQMQYSKEYTMRIMQNYDPNDQSDRPNKPWILWGFLAAAYGGAILWSSTAKTAIPRGFPVEPAPPRTDSDQLK